MSLEAPPVLRTGFSKDLPEQFQCSEKLEGREIGTRHKPTTRNAVGSKNRSSASGGVISKDTIKRTSSNCLSTMTEGREESQQLNPTPIQGTITEDKAVAFRTRKCRQQTVPISTNDGKGDLFQATHQEPNNNNELIRQLKTKIKEQENSISELSSAVERFLKIHRITSCCQEIARGHFEYIEACCSPRQIQSHGSKE